MPATIANLFINIIANTSKLTSGLKVAAAHVKKFAGVVGKGFGLGVGFNLAQLAGNAFLAMLRESVQASFRLHNAIRELGFTARREFVAISATLGNAIAPLIERINKDLKGTEMGQSAWNSVLGATVGFLADIVRLFEIGIVGAGKVAETTWLTVLSIVTQIADIAGRIFGVDYSFEAASALTAAITSYNELLGVFDDIAEKGAFPGMKAGWQGVSPASMTAVGQTSEEAISIARQQLRQLQEIGRNQGLGGPR